MKTARFFVPAVSLMTSLAGMAAAFPLCDQGTAASTDPSAQGTRVAFGRGVASGALARQTELASAEQKTIHAGALRGAFNKIAAINPRVSTGLQCYADNLTVAQLEAIMATYNALPPGQFLPGNAVPQFNMSSTAWTGNGAQGGGSSAIKASLTYSFPADGVLWGSNLLPNQLGANITTLWGVQNLDQGREYIRQCFANWRRNSGLTYTEVADSGISMDNVTGRRSTVGDIRIGAITQGLTGVLAYNYFPNGGADMTINSDYFAGTFSSATNTYRYFRNVVTHEHGHGLGLGHQTPCNNTKLMEPFANTNFDMVALDDRRGAMRAYGDRFAGNTIPAVAKNFGDLTLPVVRSVIEKDLSTNGQYTGTNVSGADWFKFTLTTEQSVSITAQPTGTSYPAANQTSGCNPTTGTTVSSLNAGNLAVTLYDAAGTTVLLSADANLNGGSELISAGTLAAGTYAVRVYDVGPNAAADQFVQTYNLTIRVGTSKAPPTVIAGVNKRVLANSRCYFYGNLNSLANEGTINGYTWDFNNDGVYETAGSGVFRTYVTNGTFAAVLRVSDTNGMSATDTINVTVTGATSAVTAVSPNTAVQSANVPITITGTNFRGISAAGVTVLGGGVTITGTPTVDYLGTTITGLSMFIAPNAVAGTRDLRVVTTDGTVTLPAAINVQTCPTFADGPNNTTVAETASLVLSSTVAGTASQTYHWLLNGSPVTSSFASGTATTTLTINPVALSDAGNYSLVASGPCGDVTSPVAVVTVTPNTPVGGCNPADIVDGGGTAPGDGVVDGSDYIAFINAFSNGDALADIAGSDGPGADGVVDGSDYITFINAFAQGC